MVYLRSGLNGGVFYTVFSYRIILPYGKSLSRSSYFVLLDYGKKMLVNTGVIESQSDLEALFNIAGLNFSDLDYVVNMSSCPEHIGLNSIIQYRNKKVRFFAPPADIAYIEDTVSQHEERYVPGFYKLVSGNTQGVEGLYRDQLFDLGEEQVRVSFNGDEKKERVCLNINKSGIEIYASQVRLSRTCREQLNIY